MFDMDPRELIKFRKLMKKRADKISVATGMFVNEMAFRCRKEAFDVFPALMTIRNPALLKRQLRVEKANLRESISTQHSEFGTVHIPRTTGFKEQQYGLKDPREHRVAMHGRSGNIKRKAIGAARLRSSRQFKHPKQFKGISKHNRAFNMIKQLSREGYRQPFIIYGYTGIKAGVYVLQGKKKMKMLHSFHETNKKIKTKSWMTISVKRMQNKLNRRALWKKVLQRIN